MRGYANKKQELTTHSKPHLTHKVKLQHNISRLLQDKTLHQTHKHIDRAHHVC